ncbi:uncharacterized protein LOC106404849 isoform X1 [Brassica napus]|uniref:uncharacterized protein LOC106404849 isoform X1 n=1 Tax=Brassica napus TaxID=3708 RepID=UPI00207923B1|nr:uncharacterized protein LOC106404849 isoform X1 [Brassica napus]
MSLNDAAKTGKIAVWWDMKECPVPEGIDAHRVRPSIEGGFKELGYSGPVSITAYGDQKQTPEYLLRALSSTGVAVEVIRPQPTELISATNKWGKNYAATPEYATAKIHVWWDMFDCPIPDGYDARLVRPSLEGAFKELGYSGPVSITAFGDHTQTPKRHLQALSSTGIDVAHATLGVISSRIFDDLMEWRGRITTPATMMIISDGVEELIAKLQQRIKFNLFWAYSCRPWTMSVVLTSAEWLWDSLLAVSATKRHVLRNCSASVVESTGMFYCKLCYTKRTLLDKFIKHLSSKKHLSQEGCITDRRRRAKKHRLFWLKEYHFPKSKRLKNAP